MDSAARPAEGSKAGRVGVAFVGVCAAGEFGDCGHDGRRGDCSDSVVVGTGNVNIAERRDRAAAELVLPSGGTGAVATARKWATADGVGPF